MCAFPLREEEKALWALVMRDVSPLRAGLRRSVSCSASSSEGERRKTSFVKGASMTPHSRLNAQKNAQIKEQIKDKPIKSGAVAYNEPCQQERYTSQLSDDEPYNSIHETMCHMMRRSVCQVYQEKEVQVATETRVKETRAHPTVHLLRSVRAMSREQSREHRRSKGCRYAIGEDSYRDDFSKRKNTSHLSVQWVGQWHGRVESRLDLHGLCVQEAFNQFMVFMAAAQQRGDRCIEIITGLGSGEEGGILRRELPHWLERADVRRNILEVVYAYNSYKRHRKGDGKGEGRKVLNRGAIRILLRQRNKLSQRV